MDTNYVCGSENPCQSFERERNRPKGTFLAALSPETQIERFFLVESSVIWIIYFDMSREVSMPQVLDDDSDLNKTVIHRNFIMKWRLNLDECQIVA
jgi:hypothetical protein